MEDDGGKKFLGAGMSDNSKRRRWMWLAWMALAVFLCAEGLHQSGALRFLDQRVVDRWFQWQGVRGEARHTAIVAIDEATLAAYPDDPLVFWSDRLALASERLRALGARAVAFDMLLSISPERWLGKLGGELEQAAREYDQPFRSEVNRGSVVLAATHSGQGDRQSDYLLPSPDYLLALPDLDIPGHVGLADLLDEGDGVIRRFMVAPILGQAGRVPDDVPVLGLPSLVAARAAGVNPHTERWIVGGREVRRAQGAETIPFLGPPGTFPRVSLQRLLADHALDDPEMRILHGRAVLIGATAAGLNDEHFTPYASRLVANRGVLMPGVELHANVVEALLTGDRLQALGSNWRIVALVTLSLAAVGLCSVLPAWAGVLVFLASTAVALAGGYFAFRLGVILPAAQWSLTTLFALLVTLGYRLTGEERERRRLRAMFGRYVSEKVVEALLQSDARPSLGGQVQTVTVLFSDIRNFTSISEQLSAEEVVEMLNAYFAQACAVLQAAGGSIDKYIGDAVMVEFGSPLPQADHAARAVRAALALQSVAEDFSGWMERRFAGRGLPRFAVGIGLHSGEAVIGNIGSPARMEFTAIGDTVNLASRLEGVTKDLGWVIVASEATVNAAGSEVRCGRSDLVTVKGREQPVRVHEILPMEGNRDA